MVDALGVAEAARQSPIFKLSRRLWFILDSLSGWYSMTINDDIVQRPEARYLQHA